MPRTTSQKKKLFALYQILYEYTDDNNGLTMAEILSKLLFGHSGRLLFVKAAARITSERHRNADSLPKLQRNL